MSTPITIRPEVANAIIVLLEQAAGFPVDMVLVVQPQNDGQPTLLSTLGPEEAGRRLGRMSDAIASRLGTLSVKSLTIGGDAA